MMLFELRLLVEQLERVDLSMSGTSIKLAFWINVYNSLVMHVSARKSISVFVLFNFIMFMIMLVSFQPTCNSFAGISSIRNTKQFSEKNGYISQGEKDACALVTVALRFWSI
jgi:hypothetical protein